MAPRMFLKFELISTLQGNGSGGCLISRGVLVRYNKTLIHVVSTDAEIRIVGDRLLIWAGGWNCFPAGLSEDDPMSQTTGCEGKCSHGFHDDIGMACETYWVICGISDWACGDSFGTYRDGEAWRSKRSRLEFADDRTWCQLWMCTINGLFIFISPITIEFGVWFNLFAPQRWSCVHRSFNTATLAAIRKYVQCYEIWMLCTI